MKEYDNIPLETKISQQELPPELKILENKLIEIKIQIQQSCGADHSTNKIDFNKDIDSYKIGQNKAASQNKENDFLNIQMHNTFDPFCVNNNYFEETKNELNIAVIDRVILDMADPFNISIDPFEKQVINKFRQFDLFYISQLMCTSSFHSVLNTLNKFTPLLFYYT
jgi:hypothetical protein